MLKIGPNYIWAQAQELKIEIRANMGLLWHQILGGLMKNAPSPNETQHLHLGSIICITNIFK
jgi:hypothetical protein